MEVKGDLRLRLTSPPSVRRLSGNCGSLNPTGLHGLLQGQIYFFIPPSRSSFLAPPPPLTPAGTTLHLPVS
jgi:hypothetical protein